MLTDPFLSPEKIIRQTGITFPRSNGNRNVYTNTDVISFKVQFLMGFSESQCEVRQCQYQCPFRLNVYAGRLLICCQQKVFFDRRSHEWFPSLYQRRLSHRARVVSPLRKSGHRVLWKKLTGIPWRYDKPTPGKKKQSLKLNARNRTCTCSRNIDFFALSRHQIENNDCAELWWNTFYWLRESKCTATFLITERCRKRWLPVYSQMKQSISTAETPSQKAIKLLCDRWYPQSLQKFPSRTGKPQLWLWLCPVTACRPIELESWSNLWRYGESYFRSKKLGGFGFEIFVGDIIGLGLGFFGPWQWALGPKPKGHFSFFYLKHG